MTAEETDALRKEVKHKLVDHDLDGPGGYDVLVPHLTLPASKRIISMALTGYRKGEAAQALLKELRQVLSSWPPQGGVQTPPCGGLIHEGESEHN